MKISHLLLLIITTLLTTTVGHSVPADYFHEATVAISKANRLEKAGKIAEAKQALQEAKSALKKLKEEDSHWFPDWVSTKESDINTIADRLKSAPSLAPVKEVNYSLKPGEWRDVTIERAYKAHAEGRVEIPPHARGQMSPTPHRIVTSPQNTEVRTPDNKPQKLTNQTISKQKKLPTTQPPQLEEVKPVPQARKVVVQPVISKKEQTVQVIKPIPMVPKVENPKPFQKPKQKRRTHRFRIGD